MIDVLPVAEGELPVFFGLVEGIYPEGPARSHVLLEQSGLLVPDFHPSLEHINYELFMAWEGTRPAGRVAAISDSRYPDPGVGFFGLFEARRNQEAAAKLIQAAGNWLKARGKTVLLGPLTFNTNEKVGLLIDGFDQPPQPSIPFNPPYYRELLENAGLTKERDFLAYLWDPVQETARMDKVNRVASRARERIGGVVVHHLAGEELLGKRTAVGMALNKCLKDDWGFVPLTDRELTAYLENLAGYDQGIYILAETAAGPAGLNLNLPNRPAAGFCRPEASYRVAVFGVVPKYQGRGLAAVLLQEMVQSLTRSGCRRAELSLIADNNILMKRIIQLTETKIARRSRVYRLTL